MSNSINREDICPGDSIKVTQFSDGVLTVRSGKVWSTSIAGGGIRTEEDGWLWHDGYLGKPVFELIDRPKPKLPHNPGSVIWVTAAKGEKAPEGSYWQMFLDSDGAWQSHVRIRGSYYFLPQEITRWKLAKVVEV